MTTIFEALESVADEFAAFGQADVANAVRETVRRAEDCRREFWNMSLTVAEAAVWGGYDESTLRRHVAKGVVPLAPDGRIRRRHVPVKPGHILPLGLEPTESAEQSWADRVRAEREAS